MTESDWLAHVQPAIDGWRRANYKRIVAAVIADVKAHCAGGVVKAGDAVRLAIKWRRIGYMRGYGADTARRRSRAA